jgi:hypothetical protein
MTFTEQRATIIRLALKRLAVAEATGHQRDAERALDELLQHAEGQHERIAELEALVPEDEENAI